MMYAKVLALLLMLNSHGTAPATIEDIADALMLYPVEELPLKIALMWTETDFRPHAVSRKGACGVTQLMMRWHGEYECEDVTEDQVLALQLADDELDKYLRHCGRHWYLATYNRGYRRCCGGFYYKKNVDVKPEGWFECEERHRSYQTKVERRAGLVTKWLADGPKSWLDCETGEGIGYMVGVFSGYSRARMDENLEKTGLRCIAAE
jgi:hypothetical protein